MFLIGKRMHGLLGQLETFEIHILAVRHFNVNKLPTYQRKELGVKSEVTHTVV